MARIDDLFSEKANVAPWNEESTTIAIRNTFIEVCARSKESKESGRHSCPAAVGRKADDDTSSETTPKHLSVCVDDSTDVSDGDKTSDVHRDTEEVKIFCDRTEASDGVAPLKELASFCLENAEEVKICLSTTAELVLVGGMPSPSGRSPLSSKAKAWTPTAQEETTGFHLRTFKQELQCVMEEVMAAVQCSGCCEEASIRWEGSMQMPICRMTVVQQEGQWCFMERLKTTAKSTLMAATSVFQCLPHGLQEDAFLCDAERLLCLPH